MSWQLLHLDNGREVYGELEELDRHKSRKILSSPSVNLFSRVRIWTYFALSSQI
jgi:hypothetical protein